jgi:hypothetical protein
VATDAVGIRVEDLSRRVLNIEEELRSNRPAVLASQLGSLGKDVEELTSEMRGLRRAVIGFAITVAASAVGFALTVILVWGGHS